MAARIVIWAATFTAIRKRFIRGVWGRCSVTSGCAWGARCSIISLSCGCHGLPRSGSPSAVLKYVVGQRQNKKCSARIKDQGTRVDNTFRKGVHVIQLRDVSADLFDQGRGAIDDVIDQGQKEDTDRKHQGDHCGNDLVGR